MNEPNRVREADSYTELLVLAKRVADTVDLCMCRTDYICLGCAARTAVANAGVEFDPNKI